MTLKCAHFLTVGNAQLWCINCNDKVQQQHARHQRFYSSPGQKL